MRKKLLLLTPAELTRDPRARRQAVAAQRHGLDVAGVSGGLENDEPAPLDGVPIVRTGRALVSGALRRSGVGGMRPSGPVQRELRGVYRLARLASSTLRLVAGARSFGDVDVVHANDLDTLPAAWLIARRRRARLVYDAHELYTTSEPDPPRLYRLVAAGLEARLARRADAVVTTGEPYATELERRLRLPRRPLIVLNAPARDERDPLAAGAGRLRAVYQAAMSHRGKPVEDLLAAAAAAPSVDVTIRVVNADAAELERRIAEAGLADRVRAEPPVPPDRLVEELRSFDAGVVLHRPVTRNEELSIPNKLFEYMMAGLVVVAPRLPGMAPIVEGEDIGLCYDPGDPASLAAALERLAADRGLVDRLRRRAHEAAVARYSAEDQAPVLLEAWGMPADGTAG